MVRHAFFLLVFASSASAQGINSASVLADTAHAISPQARFTAADTVRAIHRIYAKHRRVGGFIAGGALAADLALAGISAADENSSRTNGGSGYGSFGSGGLLHFGFGGFAVIYGIFAAPVMAIGIQQLIAYGPKHEAKVIAEYEASRRLPAKISRRIRKNLR